MESLLFSLGRPRGTQSIAVPRRRRFRRLALLVVLPWLSDGLVPTQTTCVRRSVEVLTVSRKKFAFLATRRVAGALPT